MKTKNPYHIDVTPEEDTLFKDIIETPQTPNSSFIKKINSSLFKNSMFWIIFGVHIVIVSAIAIAAKPNYKEPLPEMVGRRR